MIANASGGPLMWGVDIRGRLALRQSGYCNNCQSRRSHASLNMRLNTHAKGIYIHNTWIHQVVQERLDEYNETNAVMDLVLFENAVEHVCRYVCMCTGC
jgi:hypothetical protein